MHRRLVRSLGAVCVILWVGVLVLFVGDGLEAVPVLTIGLAVSNTALFWQFLRRIHEADRAQAEGIPVRHRRG